MKGTILDNNGKPLTSLQADDYIEIVGNFPIGAIDLQGPDFCQLHQELCDFVRTPTIRASTDREKE